MARLKAADRRSQLLEVGALLFAELGYESTTTAAIARAAGVTEPILYRHFKGKLELFSAIVRDVSQRLKWRREEILRRIDDPADQIRAVATAAPQQVMSLVLGYKVLHGAIVSCPAEPVKKILEEHFNESQEFFAGVIREGVKRGIFRVADVDQSAWLIVCMGTGYILLGGNMPKMLGVFDPDMMVENTMRMLGWRTSDAGGGR